MVINLFDVYQCLCVFLMMLEMDILYRFLNLNILYRYLNLNILYQFINLDMLYRFLNLNILYTFLNLEDLYQCLNLYILYRFSNLWQNLQSAPLGCKEPRIVFLVASISSVCSFIFLNLVSSSFFQRGILTIHCSANSSYLKMSIHLSHPSWDRTVCTA